MLNPTAAVHCPLWDCITLQSVFKSFLCTCLRQVMDWPAGSKEWANSLCEDFTGGELVEIPPMGATHCKVFGRDGPWIVFIHGFRDSARSVVDLALFVARHRKYRVIVYDRYGCGLSATPSGRYDGDFFDAQLWGLVDRIVHPGACISVIGVSMGAVCAMVSATKCPHRVEHVVLVTPPGITGSLPLDLGAKLFLTPFIGWLILFLAARPLIRRRIEKNIKEGRTFHNAPPAVVEKFRRCQLRDAEDWNHAWENRNTGMNFPLYDTRPLARSIECHASAGHFTIDIVVALHDKTCPAPPGAWGMAVPHAAVHEVATGHHCVWEDLPLMCRTLDSIMAGPWAHRL